MQIKLLAKQNMQININKADSVAKYANWAVSKTKFSNDMQIELLAKQNIQMKCKLSGYTKQIWKWNANCIVSKTWYANANYLQNKHVNTAVSVTKYANEKCVQKAT